MPQPDAKPRGRGRPALSDEERRSERLVVKATIQERERIESLAKRAGIPVGTYMRSAALGKHKL